VTYEIYTSAKTKSMYFIEKRRQIQKIVVPIGLVCNIVNTSTSTDIAAYEEAGIPMNRKLNFSTFRSMRIFVLVVVSLGLLTVFSGSALGQYEAGAAIVAIDEKPAAGARKSGTSTGEAQGKNNSSVNSPSASQRKNVLGTQNKIVPKPVTSSAPITNSDPKYNGFVVGDKYTFLNFEIVSKVQPVHTIKAKEAGAAGLVQVEVLIDQNGNVLKAHARTGNPLLHPEAEKAALATKFNRPTFGGKPARAIGFIVYRFGKAEDDD